MLFFLVVAFLVLVDRVAAASNVGCNAQVAIDNATFAALLTSVQSTPFAQRQEAIVSSFCTNLTVGFTAQQTVQLLALFPFSSSKQNVVATIAPYALGLTSADMANVLNALTFSSDKLTSLTSLVNLVTDLAANNATIVQAFVFSSDKQTAAKIIASAKPISCLWGSAAVRKHVVFVLDVSGSMSTPISATQTRLQFAVQQLALVLAELSSSQFFNIILFSTNAAAWQPGVQPASAANIALATQYVAKATAGGSTNMLAALKLATADPQAEALVVVSDGEPDCCAGQMLALTKVWQAGTRVVNTVLVQAGGFADPQAQAFLCGLAQAGAGFCRVNN